MKIYIRAAEERNLEFVIDLCFAFNDNIEAAFNPDLTDSEFDEIIEETAEEYYVSFMKTVAFNLQSMGFEILEDPTFSNQKGSRSCYFVLCKEDDYNKLTVNFILSLRISDHRLSKRKGSNKNWDRFEARNQHYEEELNYYRELNENNPDDIGYGISGIIISGQKFKTYRQALKYIKNKVKEEFAD